MGRDLLSKFQDYCQDKSLVSMGDRIAVAVSGGVDSVVLLSLLNQLKSKFRLQLYVAHLNHRLRGKESEGDEAFVRELAEKYGVECNVRKTDTLSYAKSRRASLQEAARDLRYHFFRELVNNNTAQKVATAHNANDNAETLLLNLFRGTGLQGLIGIPVQRKDVPVIRPLLFATREEIEEYARKHRLKFRTDSSNRKLYYRRNVLRRRVLPLLENTINPEVVRAVNRTSEILTRLEHMLQRQAEKALHKFVKESEDGLVVAVRPLSKLEPYIREMSIQKVGQRLTGVSFDSEKVEKILGLLNSMTGKRLELSKTLVVYRDRNRLVFTGLHRTQDQEKPVKINKDYVFRGNRFSSKPVTRRSVRFTPNRNIEYVDADRLNNRLLLRNWREGDWFVPLGMTKRKKLSDFFIDEKIPLHRKHSIPVLESHGNIVWICGVRLDNRFRLSPKTRNILKLEFQHKVS